MAAALTTFVPSGQDPDQDFTIHNLPLGVGQYRKDGDWAPAIYTRIGDEAVDLRELSASGLLSGPILSSKVGAEALGKGKLNAFAALGPSAWAELRQTLQRLLSSQEGVLRYSKRNCPPRFSSLSLSLSLPFADRMLSLSLTRTQGRPCIAS